MIILSGPVHSGKTTFLEGMCSRWRERDLRVRGFLSLCHREEDKRNGYDLLDIAEGVNLPFLRTSGEDGRERVGPFFLIPGTLARARSIIGRASQGELLVVDEVGPLELGGGGVWPALEAALSTPSLETLLVIREGLLGEFLPRFEAYRPVNLDIREKGLELRLDRLVTGPEGRR